MDNNITETLKQVKGQEIDSEFQRLINKINTINKYIVVMEKPYMAETYEEYLDAFNGYKMDAAFAVPLKFEDWETVKKEHPSIEKKPEAQKDNEAEKPAEPSAETTTQPAQPAAPPEPAEPVAEQRAVTPSKPEEKRASRFKFKFKSQVEKD